jgi:Flp pilus assembly protein TadD/class 3 adenylate cyclase
VYETLPVNRYLAVLFADLEEHTTQWRRVPRLRMVTLVAEYRYVAEGLASLYGSVYREWTGDGHMFLFESADTAAQFGLRLIDGWRRSGEESSALTDLPHLPLRVGCHFGECTPIANREGWIGRANAIAKRVESEAEPDSFYVTETVLDLLDLPLYAYERLDSRPLKGDHVTARTLYRVLGFDSAALDSKPPESLTAEDWFRKALALLDTPAENSDEEERCWLEALRLRPGFAEAHNNLAVLLHRRNRDREAARHYQEALGARHDYPEAHFNYGAMLAARSHGSGAAEHFREALEHRPDYVDAHHGYAGLLADRGDSAEAERHYREALRLRPGDARAHNDLAVLLDRLGRQEESVEHYREALRLDPDSPETHYNYALLLEDRGDQAGAENNYRAAIRLWPEYGEAHNNLAIILQENGDLERADHHFRKALAARPDDPETHYNFGLLLRRIGNAPDAERHLRIAYDLAPDVPAFRSALETPR